MTGLKRLPPRYAGGRVAAKGSFVNVVNNNALVTSQRNAVTV